MEANFEDQLGWATDKEIFKLINGETIYYSNKVHKYNSFSLKQERNLLLTNKCIYNLQNKKIKRQMKYDEMLGITFSSQSNEFVVHGDQGHDFHFVSPDKTIIIYIIAKCYENLFKKPLTLCQVKEKSLKSYVTTKKEKKRNSTSSKLNDQNIIDTQTFMIDNNPIEASKIYSMDISVGRKMTISKTLVESSKNISCKLIFSNSEKIKTIIYDDFKIIKIIGRGIMGKVFLSKNRLNNEYYALKSIQKNILEKGDSTCPSYIQIIKSIKNLKFPFLINVQLCFETDDRIYFSFPYIQGEEFLFNIKTYKNYNEEKIKFYAGIIGLTLDYLHKNGIEYKSFSSKNILIDKDGYLKIVPFHIGKILKLKKTNKTKKILDKYKDEYSPPEVFLEGDSQNLKSADWWNLGIIIFEMLYNIPPFFTDEESEIKQIIINTELKFPKNPPISNNLKDLINKLLKKKFNERLGYENGFEDIKKHEFFKGFNFDDLLSKKIEAPYKPKIGDILENNKKMEQKFTYEDLKRMGY